MAERDLDKYLADLGIATEDEEQEEPLVDLEFEPALESFYQNHVIPDGTPRERLESFLVNLLLHIDPAYAVEVSEVADNRIKGDIFGGDAGRLIGRGGHTLHALEYLANTVVNKDRGDTPVRVTLDVGGYRRRRDDRLRREAQNAAQKVRRSGVALELEPMNAAERRIVHMELADEPDIFTESTDEGPNRRVVIKPA